MVNQKTGTCCSSLEQPKALVSIKFTWNSFVLDPYETERTLKIWLTHSLKWQGLRCWQGCQPQPVTGTPVLLRTTDEWLENSYSTVMTAFDDLHRKESAEL